MSEYGVTPTGFVPKRLDTIIDEIHGDLSEKWGVNTRQNPQSFLNVLITNFADSLAELWDTAQDVYNAMYPFSAEGLSLDNAVQFGGIARREAQPTIYPVHCECVDGTVIPEGTLINSITKPAVDFQSRTSTTVSRAAFNSAKVVIAAIQPNAAYTVIVDGLTYSVISTSNPTAGAILGALADEIKGDRLTAECADGVLTLADVSCEERHSMTLSPNLTTQSVTGIVNFETLTVGDTDLPDSTITEIKTAVPGLLAVNNLIPRIAGSLQESDAELRASYAAKIFQRSSRMTDSIRAAILQNVQGVDFCEVQDNPTNDWDEYGRPPHSVEAVVSGGDNNEIATQILNTKAGGISSYGNTEVDLKLNSGESLTIRFTRPVLLYVWFRISVESLGNLPTDYADTIKAIITSGLSSLGNVDEIAPQQFIGEMFRQIPNLAHVDILSYYTADPTETPSPEKYKQDTIPVTVRQRAVTDASRIEVVLDG